MSVLPSVLAADVAFHKDNCGKHWEKVGTGEKEVSEVLQLVYVLCKIVQQFKN